MKLIPQLPRHAVTALSIAWLMLWAGGVLGACDAEPFQGELTECRCETEQCSSASCGYELRLDSDCQGDLASAEILIDGYLELDRLDPGGTVTPCTRTEPGVTSQIIVRGGEWVWGPLSETCLVPGDTRLLVLQCREAQ